MSNSPSANPESTPSPQSAPAAPQPAPIGHSASNLEIPVERPKIELEELFAHRVAEKAKAKVIAYFGILGIAISLVLAIGGWTKIDSSVEARIKEVVDPKLTNAAQRVDQLLTNAQTRLESQSRKFEQLLDELRGRAETRSSEFERIIGVSLTKVQATGGSNLLTFDFDISGRAEPILNQEISSGVVGYAFVYALRAELARLGKPVPEISPHGIYVEAKKWDEWASQEHEGTSLAGGVKALQRVGAYSLTDWPSEKQKEPKKGSKPVCRVASAVTLKPSETEAIIRYLREKRPVVISLTIYQDSINNHSGRFTVGKSVLGGHALCVVAYSEARELFKVANSWGDDWGERGFGYISKSDLQKLCDSAVVIDVAQ